MAYYSQEQLLEMGFADLGRNVKISDKACLYEVDKMRIGDNCRIDDFCVISGKVEFGRNVHIAPFCLIAGGSPGVTFGDFAGFAYRVSVFAQSDDYSGHTLTNPTVPAAYKSERKEAVAIGRHCIIGANTVIAPGVVIGDGTSVGAASLVLKHLEEWSIYAGVPVRKLKSRSKDLLKLEQRYLSAEATSQD